MKATTFVTSSIFMKAVLLYKGKRDRKKLIKLFTYLLEKILFKVYGESGFSLPIFSPLSGALFSGS